MAAGFSEYARKSVHMAMGGFALLLRWLPWPAAFLLAVVAFCNNFFLLPRVAGGKLFRADSARASGRDVGILLYPAVIGLLILIFRGRLEIVAAAWGALAFGDGLATIAGKGIGGPRLPWNRDKSWSGFVSFLLAGGLSATFLFAWVASGSPRWSPLPGGLVSPASGEVAGMGLILTLAPSIRLAVLAAVVLAAIVETLPLGMDDNLSVPLAAAGSLSVLLLVIESPGAWEACRPAVLAALPVAIAVNLALGFAAWAARSVTLSGLIGGAVLGTVIFAFGGWRSFMLLLAFFVLGSAVTKMGYARKAAAGIAQEKGGRRGSKNAVANCGVAAVLAFLASASPLGNLALLGLVASFATACSDTVSSEIGQAYGRTTWLITTFRRVPRGTEGAVSLEGTVAGILASAFLAALAWGLGLVGAGGAAIVVAAAFIGTTLESYLGATLERMRLIDNEAINFLNTLAGALAAMGMAGALA